MTLLSLLLISPHVILSQPRRAEGPLPALRPSATDRTLARAETPGYKRTEVRALGTEAAYGVLRRTIGRQADQFDLTLTPKGNYGLDVFTVEASNGRVKVSGTSPVAICRGAYEYLKDACHVQVNWSESNVKMPPVPPDYAKREVVCPNRYRHYFNICTFGYSAVWWDAKRWQHEVDWMALHGINMPLALTGQEKVWQKVFRSYGIPDKSIGNFFSGPAFFPWHWMGNLNQHGGPLSQSFIEAQAKLQKGILKRERELGMTPVVPGFSGFVPVDFSKFVPGVKLSSPTAWAGFAPTTFVDVRNPKFIEIGKRFVTEYQKEFGTNHLYLCDTFNEQNPQFPKETEMEDLSAAGRSVYESIHQADPQGTWVMQGWLFYNERDYWSIPRVNALVRDVPKGRMIVLDLATSEYPVWKHQPAVKEGGWIYNTLHNYGQNTGLYAPLQAYANDAMANLNDPDHGRMLGMGLTMEGIDQNPVLYELMTDLMWVDRPETLSPRATANQQTQSTAAGGEGRVRGANEAAHPDPTNIPTWTRAYALSRYGGETDSSRAAWSYLLDSVYSKDARWSHASWRTRPSLGAAHPSIYDVQSIRFATVMLDSMADKFANNPLWQRDTVDVAKTWLGALADAHLVAAVASFDEDRPTYEKHKKEFLDLLHNIDRVMAVMPEHRLSTWIRNARSWGSTPQEKDQMEWNARMQITIWGGPVLYDYANKEWAGLTDDFLKARWQLFFDALERAGSTSSMKLPDYGKWEEAWTRRTTPPQESKPEPIGPLVRDLLREYGTDDGDVAKILGINRERGIAVGAKVRDSGHTEAGGSPSYVTDGSLTTGYWSASPAPQWVEIDLGQVKPTTGAQLFPYYGDGRSYQYKVEVSQDGQTWQTVADASTNTRPATIRGHRHTWPATPTRYLRVTMLHNSANIGVHLYEVRVFDK